MDLRHLGHRNGESYFFTLGGSGGEDCPGPEGKVISGVGSGVSKSR